MDYAKYIGRVGALAVALGIGTAIANTPGLASADPGSTSTDNPPGGEDSNTEPAPTPGAEPPGRVGSPAGSKAGAESPSGKPKRRSAVGGMRFDNSGGALTSRRVTTATEAKGADGKGAKRAADADKAKDVGQAGGVEDTNDNLPPTAADELKDPRKSAHHPKPHRISAPDDAPPRHRLTNVAQDHGESYTTTGVPVTAPSVADSGPSVDPVAAVARSVGNVAAPLPKILTESVVPTKTALIQSIPDSVSSMPTPPSALEVVATLVSGPLFGGPLLGPGPAEPAGSPLTVAAIAWGTRPRFRDLLPGNPSLDTARTIETSQPVQLAALSQTAATTPDLVSQTSITVQNNPSGDVVANNQTYVLNQASNTVSVVNPVTSTVTKTITVGTAPTAVAATPDQKYVYVTNSGSGNVTVIDTSTNTVKATVKVGSTPQDVVVNAAGTSAYVLNSGSGSMSVINTSTNKVVSTVSVGSNPTAVAVNPNGRYVYVARSNGTVAVVDTALANIVTNTIRVGSAPKDLVVSPTTGKLFVANSGSNSISVINMSNNTVTTTVPVASSPTSLAISPAGDVLYVAHTTDTLTRINTSTITVMGTTAIDPAPESVGAHSVAVSADGRRIYVTDGVDRALRVLAVDFAPSAGPVTVGLPDNAGTGKVTGSFTVTDADGDAVTYTVTPPANGDVTVVTSPVSGGATTYTFTYTPNAAARGQVATDTFNIVLSDRLITTTVPVSVPVAAPSPQSQFDITPVAVIPVGTHPIGTTVSGAFLYVANSGDNSVTVVDTRTNQVTNTITGVAYPSALAATEDGQRVYLAYYDTVTVIDTVTNERITATIPEPCETECWGSSTSIQDVVVSPDGSDVYVSRMFVGDSFYAGSLWHIDPETNDVTLVNSGQWLTDLEFNPDGTRLYAGVGDYRWVNVYDGATGSGIATVTVSGTYWPVVSKVQVSPTGDRAYAVVPHDVYITSSDTLSVIDTATSTEIASITVPAGANDVVFSPDGKRAYVSHEGGQKVTVIDTATNTVIGTITSDQIGGDYASFTAGPDGTLYFTSYANGTVSAVTVSDPTTVL